MKLSLDVVDPELRDITRRYDKLATVPDSAARRRFGKALIRVVRFPRAKGVELGWQRIAGSRVRTYEPAVVSTDAVLFWIHGGGLISGYPTQNDHLCSTTAATVGMRVFSSQYPLAPEQPYPAALDRLHATWAELTKTHTRVVIGGESAGGCLAAALVQRLHDEGGLQPIGQWLLTPMLDDRTAARRELDEPEHLIWSNRANLFGWTSYLGVAAGAETVPEYAVPARRANLAGLPPAYVMWGDIELFADEDRSYAERLRAAGVEVETDVVAGGPHGFQTWAPDAAPSVALLGRAGDWLRRMAATPATR